MTAPIRIANRDAWYYTEQRIPFKGNNLFAAVTKHGDYAVYSYGTHHALLVAVSRNGRTLWFANKYKRSITTAKHMTQARPKNVDVVWLDHEQMTNLVWYGYEKFIRSHLNI